MPRYTTEGKTTGVKKFNFLNGVLGIGNTVRYGDSYGVEAEQLAKILENLMNSFNDASSKRQKQIEAVFVSEISAKALELAHKTEVHVKNGVDEVVEYIRANIEDLQKNTNTRFADLIQQIQVILEKDENVESKLNDLYLKTEANQAKNYNLLLELRMSLKQLQESTGANKEMLTKICGINESQTASIGRILMCSERLVQEVDGINEQVQNTSERVKDLEHVVQLCLTRIDGIYEKLVIDSGDIFAGRRCAEMDIGKLNSIVNGENATGEADVDSIIQQLNWYHTELEEWFEAIHKDNEVITQRLNQMSGLVPVPPRSCSRCGGLNTRIYKCDICGYDRMSDDAGEDLWKSLELLSGSNLRFCFVEEEQLLLFSLGTPDDDGVLDFSDQFSFHSILGYCLKAKSIVFDNTIKAISFPYKLNNSYRTFKDMFPKLKKISFRAPASKNHRYLLGESIHRDIKKNNILIYGLEYVESVALSDENC